MGRVIGLDYGKKRTGVAVSDPLKIIANPLETVETKLLLPFLKKYTDSEQVDCFVIGMPKDLQNRDTDSTESVRSFIGNLKKQHPDIPVHTHDERFTSKIAMQTMIDAGTTKKYRREKGNIDKIAAVIILQEFLG